jgi:hypothetical protein
MRKSFISSNPGRSRLSNGIGRAGAALLALTTIGIWSATAVIAADSKDAKKTETGSGWFSKSSSEPAAKPAANATNPVAAPAPAASGGTAPAAEIQTMDQLSKAGVKSCLQIAKAVGQATMFGTEYAAASTWNSKQPDNRFSVSMIGQKLAPNAGATNGISGVFSAPTANGKCDAAALQIIPTQDACSKIQSQVLEKGKLLGDLAGIPILQNAANAQVMLIPASGNSCVVVALSTAYTE